MKLFVVREVAPGTDLHGVELHGVELANFVRDGATTYLRSEVPAG